MEKEVLVHEMIASIPFHFNPQSGGSVSVQSLVQGCGWEADRAQRALDHLVKEGLAWVDDQSKHKLYWFPALFKATTAQTP